MTMLAQNSPANAHAGHATHGESCQRAGTGVYELLSHEEDYPDLDGDGAIEHLSQALRCKTTSYVDVERIDYAEFDRLHAIIRSSYPNLMSLAEVETMGHSLLITVHGTDHTLRPVQLMAHQDVVPIVPGTEGEWSCDPFSGAVDDDFIWGRGAIDIKEMLIGELESAEYVLARNGRPRRTLILAFGEDEECLQQGSRAIARALQERGVRLEFLLDEGSYEVSSGAPHGAPGFLMKTIALGEKGYCDVRITARSQGGHSSRPFGGTSLGKVSQAVARIVDAPYPARLSPLVRETLAAVAPHVSQGPLAEVLGPRSCPDSDAARMVIDSQASHIAQRCLEVPELFPYVTTTIAPTMLEGGSQGSNVLPHDVWAVINFRLDPGTSSQDVLDHCRELTEGLGVELDMFQQPSEPSELRGTHEAQMGLGMSVVSEAARRYFQDPHTKEPVEVVPTIATGGTDARMYEGICDACLRLGPMICDHEECERGVHGTDERVTKRAYLQGIRLLIRVIEGACL